MRIAPLLAAVLVPCALASAAAERETGSGWRFHSYADESTGRDVTLLALSAETREGWTVPQLLVACEDWQLLLLADFATPLGKDDLDVVLQVGDGPALDRRWDIVEDSFQMLAHPARGDELLNRLEEMETAGRVRLTVSLPGKRPLKASFRTAGLGEMLRRLDCVPQ